MSHRREIKILLTHKNLLLIKKKISMQGEVKFFLPTIPLAVTDQPVRVIHAQLLNTFHHIEMKLKSFFGKRIFKLRGFSGKGTEVFPYHIDLTHQKNLEVLYDFLKKYNIDNFNFLNFRWFDLKKKDSTNFNDEDRKIVEELSFRAIYGEEAIKNPMIKKFIMNKRENINKELS